MDALWVEGQGVIKMAVLNFIIKFLWLAERYHLCPTTMDNLLILDGAAAIVSRMAGYDIDFQPLLDMNFIRGNLVV